MREVRPRAILRMMSIVVMVALSLIGPFLVVYGTVLGKKAEASLDWPHVMGKVTRALLERDSDGSDYSAVVEYDYSVNGVRYRGKRLRFGGWYQKKALALAELDAYPQGSEVPVFYNPNKPSDAVLLREAQGTRLWILLGILITVMAFAGDVAIAAGIDITSNLT